MQLIDQVQIKIKDSVLKFINNENIFFRSNVLNTTIDKGAYKDNRVKGKRFVFDQIVVL